MAALSSDYETHQVTVVTICSPTFFTLYMACWECDPLHIYPHVFMLTFMFRDAKFFTSYNI